jgi:hypothetical protein
LPVLEFDEGDSTGSAPFNWMASAWKARDELAVADPHPGDMVTVTRLADKGRSQDWVITIAQRPKPSTAERAVVNFGDEVPFGTDDE